MAVMSRPRVQLAVLVALLAVEVAVVIGTSVVWP